ncbi:UDP-galactose transporter senju, partial [Fragariocoptes setiger]
MSALTMFDRNLFPTRISLYIFVAYISLFVSQSLLVTASKNSHDNTYDFNTILVVLITESLKLLICIIWYIHDRPSSTCSRDLLNDLISNRKLAFLYFLPSLLYCLYNNLTFVGYQAFDPTSYNCIMQFRIVLTAIIYQTLFNRRLNCIQWSSLCILTIGCLLKQYGCAVDLHTIDNDRNHTSTYSNHSRLTNQSTSYPTLVITTDRMDTYPLSLSDIFNVDLLLLLFQMFCSCLAGVYSEYLLKGTGKDVDITLQNIFMYSDSIICNAAALMLAPAIHKSDDVKYEQSSIYSLMKPLVLAIIINNAASGIVTSFFLKNLNSILKTYASALELFVIAILASLLFGTRIDIYTIIALVFVSLAMIIYAGDPVSVAPPNQQMDTIMGRRQSRRRLVNSELTDTESDDDDEEIDLYSYKFKNIDSNIQVETGSNA